MAFTGQLVDQRSIQRSRSQLPIIEHYPHGFSLHTTISECTFKDSSLSFDRSCIRATWWSLNSREKTLDTFATSTPEMTSGCQTTHNTVAQNPLKIADLNLTIQ